MLRNAVKNDVADKFFFFFGPGAGEFALVFKLAIFFDIVFYIAIYGKVMQVVDEGLLVTVRETDNIGAERIPNRATVLVIGNFPGVYDDDKVQVVGRLAGSDEYTTVMGSKRTVRALTGASATKLVEFPANVR